MLQSCLKYVALKICKTNACLFVNVLFVRSQLPTKAQHFSPMDKTNSSQDV